MNKILIVGHPTSGYQHVERLLNDCGMSTALPSRRDGLSASEIGATLLKAHGVHLLTQADRNDNLRQIEAGSIWQGMALDLMLGNLDQSLWGWADPHAVHLLDYWKSVDPSIAFILVYDAPQSLLTKAADIPTDISSDGVRTLVDKWCAYNGELLHFYHRNVDRALLVHAEQVHLTAHQYVQQVRARIGAPLRAPLGVYTNDTDVMHVPEASFGSVLPTPEGSSGPTSRIVSMEALKGHLADGLIKDFPQAEQLYGELQSVATLPLADLVRDERNNVRAWHTAIELDLQVIELEATITRTCHELQESQRDREQYERTIVLQTALAEAATARLRQAEEQIAAKQDIEQENDLLISQLHQVQAGLELSYIENRQQREQIELLRPYKKLAKDASDQIDDLSKRLTEQTEITSRLRDDVIEKASLLENQQDLEHKNEQFLRQLGRAEQDRQRMIEENLAQSSRIESLLGVEAIVETYKGELEVVKQSLSERTQLAERQADQLRSAADRNKLLQIVEQENGALLTQLHQVQKELERYYLENQSLKHATRSASTVPANETGHFGAPDRVKQQLSYRLGATMISHSHSFGGWLSMPWALFRQCRKFRVEKALKSGKKLPPLSQYRDVHEVEKVKRHLSYRLGSKLIAGVRSPIGWVKLPFELRNEIKLFRLERLAQK